MNRTGYLYLAAGFLLWLKLNLPLWLVSIVLFAFYAATGGYKFINVFRKTIKRDLIGFWRYAHMFWIVRKCQRNNLTVPMVFEQNVKKHPDKVCFIFEDKEWTYKNISDLSNKIANIFVDAGFQPGDAVSLLLDNRPEYVAIWLGLAKAGCVTALVNYNLRNMPLLHSINITESKAVIFGADYFKGFDEVRRELDPSIKLYAFDFGSNATVPKGTINLDAELNKASTSQLSGPRRSNFSDKILYIFTSGTTGLPKAAIIKHSRYFFASSSAFYMCGVNKKDRLYIALPMYHMNGGVLGTGIPLIYGCTAAIRAKFSVTHFWTDCIRYQCTVAQYIGEICRYLLAAPARPEDRSHQVRLMLGNGLRPQIWEEFVKRFNINKISEFYGATEGNANMINFEGRVGSVGFVSLIVPSLLPIGLIKVTEDTAEPIRGEDGLCIKCQPGESGMLVGKIQANHPIRDFHGYADPKATSKKVARDVYSHGDTVFLTGDILVMDESGYLFFKDRTGDTFRWRGENVSTTEVEAVISNVAGLKDCCVYGVEVPGNEGRAGMAAILDPERSLNLSDLGKEIGKVLPGYARPLFIRLLNAMELTGTYKLKKTDYQKEGFDVSKIKDDVYFFQPSSQSYIPYTTSLHQMLLSGKMRV